MPAGPERPERQRPPLGEIVADGNDLAGNRLEELVERRMGDGDLARRHQFLARRGVLFTAGDDLEIGCRLHLRQQRMDMSMAKPNECHFVRLAHEMSFQNVYDATFAAGFQARRLHRLPGSGKTNANAGVAGPCMPAPSPSTPVDPVKPWDTVAS